MIVRTKIIYRNTTVFELTDNVNGREISVWVEADSMINLIDAGRIENATTAHNPNNSNELNVRLLNKPRIPRVQVYDRSKEDYHGARLAKFAPSKKASGATYDVAYLWNDIWHDNRGGGKEIFEIRQTKKNISGKEVMDMLRLGFGAYDNDMQVNYVREHNLSTPIKFANVPVGVVICRRGVCKGRLYDEYQSPKLAKGAKRYDFKDFASFDSLCQKITKEI